MRHDREREKGGNNVQDYSASDVVVPCCCCCCCCCRCCRCSHAVAIFSAGGPRAAPSPSGGPRRRTSTFKHTHTPQTHKHTHTQHNTSTVPHTQHLLSLIILLRRLLLLLLFSSFFCVVVVVGTRVQDCTAFCALLSSTRKGARALNKNTTGTTTTINHSFVVVPCSDTFEGRK